MKRLTAGLVVLGLWAGATAAQEADLSAFLETFDSNGDKQVTQAEAETRRLRVFTTLDRDRDEQLSREELVRRIRVVEQAMAQNGADRRFTASDIDGLIAFYDRNGDSMVSKSEYNAVLPQWFAFHDRNKDKVISAKDFGRRG